MSKNRATFALLIAIVILGLTALGVGAQSGTTFFVSNVDSSGFPAVGFNLRAVELGNKVVSDLNANSLTVYENGQPAADLQVTPKQDGPVTYVFVIDQGHFANYNVFGINLLRQAVTTLVSGGYFKDGVDTVMVLARQNVDTDQTATLLPATQSATDLTTWAGAFGFERGSGPTKGLLAVEDAISEVNTLVPTTGSQSTAILFLTRFIEDPTATVAATSATNTAAEATSEHTSIYVFQTDLSQSRSDALQILATGSGGVYTPLNRSGLLSQMTSVYQQIDSGRTYYAISYRSAVADSGRREITINSPTRPAEGTVGSYEVSPQAPAVTITEPAANSTIQREATVSQDNPTPVYDTTRKQVSAQVSFPDGFPRHLTQAQLFVNGTLEDTVELTPDQTAVDFTWDMSDFTSVGTNPATLRVTVTDELGMTGEGDSTVDVEVAPAPTPVGGILGSVPTVAAIGVPVLCLLVLLALAIVVGAFLLFRGRSKTAGATDAEPEAQVMRTMFAAELPELALATLNVLEGPSGMIGERLKITTLKVSIGRDPNQADITFYSDTESSVSRLHCTIELSDDNAFRLTDKGSSAGTRLNGRRIQPESPVVLADGDEIVLGDLAQRGVKLQFNFATTEENISPYSGTADDRTHLMGDAEDEQFGGS